MKLLKSSVFFVVGLINLYPVIGVWSPQTIEQLYGIELLGAELEILMMHRALLFGLLGALLVVASFRTSLQTIATIAGLTSMISFVIIAFRVGSFNPAVEKVVIIDIGAAAALLLCLFLDSSSPASGD